MGIKIRPQPYKFRQDIEIEVIHAQASFRKKDFDAYERSIRNLKNMLEPFMEKWTKVKEVEYSPKEHDESAFEREYDKIYYFKSWIQFIEETEGNKGLSLEEWNKLIDYVLRQRVLAYKKYRKKGNFLGYLHKWFYFYLLTAYRKLKTVFNPIIAQFNNVSLQKKFLQAVKKLPKIQKMTFEYYYFKNMSYKEISKIQSVSESTVRNNKVKALKNLHILEPAIYTELKRKFKGSKKIFLK